MKFPVANMKFRCHPFRLFLVQFLLLVLPSPSSICAQSLSLSSSDTTIMRLGLKPITSVLDRRFEPYKENAVVREDALLVVSTLTPDGSTEPIKVNVVTCSDYRNIFTQQKFKEAWIEEAGKMSEQEEGGIFQESQGVLPDIKLPVDLPKGLADIIGQGGGLKVTGRNRISFGGTSTFSKPEIQSEIFKQSKFPRLELDQQLQVRVEGNVGEKITVFLDHDSQREFQGKNNVRVKYDGDDEEIVQEIELGKINVSLPGSRFVSGNVPRGNFGAKALTTMGPLDFTVIATKQEGEVQRKSFVGRATVDTVWVQDIDYEKNKHFFLGNPDSLLVPGNTPISGTIRVYIDDKNGTNNTTKGAVQGVAHVDPDNPDSLSQLVPSGEALSESVTGFFDELIAIEDFTINDDNLSIDFVRTVQDAEIIGVTYVTANGDSVGEATSDSVSLKLIKRQNVDPTSATWVYERRNIYRIPGANFDPSQLNVVVFRGDPTDPIEGDTLRTTGEVRTFINIFGLDKDNNGIIERDPAIIDGVRNLLIFPDREPFYRPSVLTAAGDELTEPNSAIYNERFVDLRRNNRQVYTIMISSKSVATSFSLNQIGILEGSERVKVGETVLKRGQDYEFIYEIGQIEFTNPEILQQIEENPTLPINIDYEFEPLIAVGSTSLLGFRTDYDPAENLSLASTWLIQSEKSIEQRVRLGDEPGKFIVGEVDGDYKLEPAILTKFVDALPFINADAPSRLDLSGEIALSMPNPNTRGEVFLDDFEGSAIIDQLSLLREAWQYSSVPPPTAKLNFMPDTTTVGDLYWVNERVDTSVIRELNPNEQAGFTTLLRVTMDPGVDGTQAWRSLVLPLSRSGGSDFTQREFIELIVLGQTGRLIVDLGSVSEDAVRLNSAGVIVSPNDKLDSEDANIDGRLDEGEDVGLDGVAGIDGQSVENDDGNDDFDLSDLRTANGTERNSGTSATTTPLPDTEDLNNNFTLDTREDLLRYQIDLANDNENNRKYFVENLKSGFRLFRIPIQESVEDSIGVQDLHNVEHIRISFTDFQQPTETVFAQLEIRGNRWVEEDVVAKPAGTPTGNFSVSVINTRDNFNSYESPPGVSAEVRRDELVSVGGRTTQIKEQSLLIDYKNLDRNELGSAFFSFLRDQNLLEYGSLSFFLGSSLLEGANASELPNFFVRIGVDSLNYYEYNVPALNEGIAKVEELSISRWQELSVPLLELTTTKKLALDSLDVSRLPTDKIFTVQITDQDTIFVITNPGDPDTTTIDPDKAILRLRGNPTLSRVRRLTIGVENRNEFSITGQLWLDELRLTDVIQDRGRASRFSINGALSDVANFRVDFLDQDGAFRQLGAARSRFAQNTLNLSGTLEFGRFFPDSWGLKMPFTVSRSRSKQLPREITGSDIVLRAGPEQEAEKSENFNSKAGLRISKARPSVSPWLRATVDKITTDLSYTDTYGGNPNQRTISNQFNININYRNNLPDFSFTPFPKPVFGFLGQVVPRVMRESAFGKSFSGSRVRLSPADIQISLRGVKAEREFINNRAGAENSDVNSVGTGRLGLSFRPLDSVTSNFSIETTRDFTQPDSISKFSIAGIDLGVEVNRKQTLDMSYSPRFFRWLNTTYRYTSNFNEDHSFEVSQNRRLTQTFRVDSLTVLQDSTGISSTEDVIVQLNNFRGQDIGIKFSTRIPDLSTIGGTQATTTLVDSVIVLGSTFDPVEAGLRFDFIGVLESVNISGKTFLASRQIDARNFNNNIDNNVSITFNLVQLAGDLGLNVSGSGGGGRRSRGTRSSTRTRQQQRGKKPDSGEKEEEDKEKGPNWFGTQIGRIISAIDPINFRWRDGKNNTYEAEDESPPIMFKLGLMNLGKEPRSKRVQDNLNLDSGLTLPYNVGLKFGYQETGSDNLFQGSTTFQNSRSFPNLSISLRSVSLPQFIKKALVNSDFQSGYTIRHDEQGRATSGMNRELTSQSKITSWTPRFSWNATWGGGVRTTFKNDLTTSTTNRFTSAGTIEDRTESSYNFSFTYSFSSPGGVGLPLPWLSSKKLSFKNDLRTQIDITRKTSTSEVIPINPNSSVPKTVTQNIVETSIGPRISYDFSRITSGLNFTYRNRDDRKSGKKTINIGVNFFMEFIF